MLDIGDGLDAPSHQLDEDLTLLCAFPSTSPVDPSLSYASHDHLCPHHSAVPLWEEAEAASPPISSPPSPPAYPSLHQAAPLRFVHASQHAAPAAETYFPGHEVVMNSTQIHPPPCARASPPPLGEIEIPYTPTYATAGGFGGSKCDRKRKPSTPLLQHKYASLGEAAPAGWDLARPEAPKKRKTPSKTKKGAAEQTHSVGKKGGKKGAKGTAKSLSLSSFANIKARPDGDFGASPRSSHPEKAPAKPKKAPSVPKSAGDMPQRCSYELCTNPLHTSGGSWKLVTGETRAGGQDWSAYIGRLFCNACFTQHATKGSMQRLGKQAPPPAGLGTAQAAPGPPQALALPGSKAAPAPRKSSSKPRPRKRGGIGGLQATSVAHVAVAAGV